MSRLAVALVGVATLVLCTTSAYAVDTEIGAKVCQDSTTAAQIQITEPTDDSVTSQATVTLRGTLNRVSQIVIEIDGVYNNTLAIASNQTVFATNITLAQGTHTIKVTANELCGGQDGTDQIVLTFEPAVEPSSGGVTPTVVEPAAGQTGVVITDNPISPDDAPTAIEQLPLIGSVYNTVKDFTEMIGLQETFSSDQAPAVVGVARVGLTAVGLSSIVMASVLAPLLAQAMPGISEVFKPKGHRSMIYLGWLIRGVGLIAMFSAYFI